MKPLHVLGLCVLMLISSVTGALVFWLLTQKETPAPVLAGKVIAPAPVDVPATPLAPVHPEQKTAEGEKHSETKPSGQTANTKAPSGKESDSPGNELRQLTGVLEVVTHSAKDLPPDYRVYVDGKIVFGRVAKAEDLGRELLNRQGHWVDRNINPVATKQNGQIVHQGSPAQVADTAVLLPGKYKVEHVVSKVFLRCSDTTDQGQGQVPQGRREFPFAIQQREVVVEAGKTATLKFDIGWAFEEGLGIPKPYNYDENDYKTHHSRVQQAVKDAQDCPVVRALLDVYRAFDAAPAQPKVYINLPDSYHGGRQFDATQVRLLVEWLKGKHWSWFHVNDDAILWTEAIRIAKSDDDVRRFRERRTTFLAAIEPMKRQVEAARNAIEQLNVIANKLESFKR